MFQGTGKKEFHCHRCMLKDARRRFLNSEDFVQVQFREIHVNSRSPSPHGHNKGFNNHSREKAGIQQENRTPQHTPILEASSKENNFSCKRCLHHHQAYRKVEHLVEHRIPQPVVFKQEDHRTQENAPRKTRRASPKGFWTTDSLRGLDIHSPSPTSGRCVPSPLQRFTDKWKEEHLSLRFSDTPLTDCVHCLHHNGFDTTNYKLVAQPDQNHNQLGHGFSSMGSKGNLEAKKSLPKDNIGELAQKESDVAWWAYSEEKPCGCRRCSSHHMNHEKLLNSNEQIPGEIKSRAFKNHIQWLHHEGEIKGQQQPMATSYSSPEFATPTKEFSRSRTPTPQRSYNYQELYERKLQAGDASNRNNTFELCPIWKPSRKIPKHDTAEYLQQCTVSATKRKDDSNRLRSPIAWNMHEVKPSNKTSAGKALKHHKIQGVNSTPLLMKNAKSNIDYQSRSPKWSKECLHKRELTRRIDRENTRAIDRIAMKEKGRLKNQIKLYGKLLVGRTQRSTRGQGSGSKRAMLSPKFERGNIETRMAYKSQVLTKAPKFTEKSEKLLRSTSPHQKDRRVVTLEEKEPRWAPPSNWTRGNVTIKGVQGQIFSPKKILKHRESLPTNISDQKENFNLNKKMNFTDASRTVISPNSRMQSKEMSSKGKNRQGYLPHDEKTNVDCKFEVIDIETKEFEERNPNYCIPDSCRTQMETQNLNPNPKHIFLRIPKLSQKNNNDKDQKAATNAPNTKTKEKSSMSKDKCIRDMKLRLEIRSEMPLEVVDGRLKQFLKGVGGLVYYSPKDGGIPRIKELANYFSGKQPLLWFSPRST